MRLLPSFILFLTAAVALRADPAASPMANMADMAGDSSTPHEFTVAPERQQMIGVTYATATVKPLRRTIRAAGRVAASAAKHWDYVARVDGYVHDLGVLAPGDPVRKGQVLMDLYSPDLAATEGEYLDLLRMRDEGRRRGNPAAAENARRLLEGARARLRQWNIADAEIEALEKAGKAPEYLPLASPFDGVVEEVAVHQGRRVSAGDHLVDIVDLSSVWVWADFYEDELPLLRPGQAVAVTSAADPGLSLAGRIAVVDPFLDPVRRTGRVRVDLDNPGGRLRPDAYVDATLELDGGSGLVVPAGAVLPTGEHEIVFVDKGEGRLEPRFVKLGGRFGQDLQVLGGLEAGERVVASANFLIDAESKIQGALKDF